MISRPTHCRVVKPAAITGRDSTARLRAMRGPTAAWRAMAQGGPHQEVMAISLPLYGKPDNFNTDQGSQFTGAAFIRRAHQPRHRHQHGRQRGLAGQCVRRTAMAQRQI
jgi:hypothetical protein